MQPDGLIIRHLPRHPELGPIDSVPKLTHCETKTELWPTREGRGCDNSMCAFTYAGGKAHTSWPITEARIRPATLLSPLMVIRLPPLTYIRTGEPN
jgi:hypothetical protein